MDRWTDGWMDRWTDSVITIGLLAFLCGVLKMKNVFQQTVTYGINPTLDDIIFIMSQLKDYAIYT